SGFVLIALVGLPGTILAAALINLAVAGLVYLAAGRAAGELPQMASSRAAPARAYLHGMLAASLVTGAASFMYEIGWIRMLSMVLGSATHAFELMLSAFILGLACGGLWIKRRIDAIAQVETYLGVMQVVMGLLALATLVVYGRTFE